MDGFQIGQNRPDLTFDTEPCVSGDVAALGELANTMLDTEGKLSAGDKLLLKNAAEALLMGSPNLPTPDRDALTNWLAKLNEVQVSVPSGDNQAPLDPQTLQQLLSTNPDEVEQGLDTLINSRLTPEQKTILKEGLSRVAVLIAQKNSQPEGSNNLKSWNPEVIKQELTNLLKEAGVELSPDDQAALEEALKGASEDISTLNIISGEPPSRDSVLETLSKSTNEAEVFDALLGQVDCGNMSEEDVAALKSQLHELAQKIVDANKGGHPLPELESTDENAVSTALKGLLDLSSLSDTAKAAIGTAISEIGKSIADKNKSEVMTQTIYYTSVEFGAPSTGNPYMRPGIMAILAPIMSELSEIYALIITQSSQMKQNMMGLMLAMAQEAFSFAMAAGQAKVNILQIEVTQHITSAVMSGVMIGVSLASAGAQAGAQAGAYKYWQSKNPSQQTAEYGQLKANYEKSHPGQTFRDPDPKATNPLEMRTTTFSDYLRSPEGHFQTTQFQAANTLLNAVTSGLGQMGSHTIEAVFTAQKIDPTLEEARMNAMKEFIGQLIGVITDCMRTFAEEMQRADKDWQSFNQLFRDMGATIRQAIYGSA